jgi:hypothetical protein
VQLLWHGKKTKKKTRKRRPKTTEWSQGQPLAFPKKKNPTDINLLARSVVEATIGEPIKPRNPKKQRKKHSKAIEYGS